MNGAPSEPGNSNPRPNAEDIDSILGRFQDWANTRRDQSASRTATNSGIGRGPASRKANLGGGVREISYEQALRASCYRRQTHPVAAEISAQALKPEPIAVPRSELTASDSTTNQHHAVEGSTKSSPSPNTIEPADSTTARSTRSRASKMETGATAERISRAGRATRRSPVPTGKSEHAQPAFGRVLKGTAGRASSATAVLETKSVALSLRVSDIEQARIVACAARANLSVSAYLRQCALGVDELRDQVELALVQLRKHDTTSRSPPGLSTIPGILGHFAARLFRRLRRNHDYTVISLR
jgi:hypothetical protein